MKKVALIIVFILHCTVATIAQTTLPSGLYLIDEQGEVACKLFGTKDTLMLNPDPILTVRDFEEAVIAYQETINRKNPVILIRLTPAGRSKFMEFSGEHIGETSGTVVNGELLTAIRISTALYVQYLEISNTVSKRKLQRLADRINNEIKTSKQ
jgi:preprotein translocase subunit SecD